MAERESVSESSWGKATTIFESATEFGLEAGEIWDAVMTTLDELPGDMKAAYIDELSAALATRLLEKERRLWLASANSVHALGNQGSSRES
jgi:hypothetical protein